MGILDADSYFGGALQLDAERASAAILANIAKPLGISLHEALELMEQAYVEKIAAAMARHVEDPAETSLLAFGGAGPMTACRVAEALGIGEIIIPRMAAVFSAFGIGFSDIAHAYDTALSGGNGGAVDKLVEELTRRARRDMFAEGFELTDCTVETSIGFTRGRQSGSLALNQDTSLPDELGDAKDLRVQLRATKAIPHFTLGAADTRPAAQARASRTRTLGGQQKQAVPLFRHEDLRSGEWAAGPAIVEEDYFTCVIPRGWRFLVNESQDLVLNRTTVGVES